jgi:hypothetical protein
MVGFTAETVVARSIMPDLAAAAVRSADMAGQRVSAAAIGAQGVRARPATRKNRILAQKDRARRSDRAESARDSTLDGKLAPSRVPGPFSWFKGFSA